MTEEGGAVFELYSADAVVNKDMVRIDSPSLFFSKTFAVVHLTGDELVLDVAIVIIALAGVDGGFHGVTSLALPLRGSDKARKSGFLPRC